jgi:hypothetical protein
MAELELLEYYKKMCERNIMLDFQGAISQDMLVGMAELIRAKFSQEYGTNMVRKMFSVFVEMAQNIAHYSTERTRLANRRGDVGAGIIMVTEKDGIYTITSGNQAENGTVEKIIDHCETINRMNKEELKSFYKQQMKAPREEGKEGAGVGMIDIVRKAGNPILYKVTPIDGANSFLVLSVKIQEDKTNE